MSRIPLDIEELQNKKRAYENASRPRFLSAAERQEQQEALAFAKRARQIESKSRASGVSENGAESSDAHTISRGNISTIDDQKKKKRRVNDPRKFTFDWNRDDDTSVETDPVYTTRHKAQFFGRGSSAGFHPQNTIESYKQAVLAIQPDRAEALDQLGKYNKDSRWDDRHWTQKNRQQMRERDWRIFKEDFGIQVKGASAPDPIRNWKEAEFPQTIMDMIDSVGYLEPTPIQKATIPVGLQARDLIGIAETGSGKTASFVLPMLVYISSLPPIDDESKNNGPYAIVLAPTRELAQQIEIETRKFANPLGLRVVSIVGGHSIEEQAFNLRDGAEILIATPGRLLDCLERHVLVLSQCTYVVMDEADRMVDLGFEEAVNQVLDALPVHNIKPDTESAENSEHMSALIGGKDRYRQTVMFSATMPTAVEKLARKYLRRPVTVIIGNAGQVVETVEQRVEIINGEEKRKRRMEEILNSGEFDKPVIVFVNTKRSCDILAKYLAFIGWNAVTLHGGKTQDQREASLTKLRAGNADVLVATDLAGRGIDITDVSLVLNFNMAKTIEDYVHRIGRTGRAGKKGVALTFIGDDEEDLFYPLKIVLKNAANIPAAIRNATKLVIQDSREIDT